jgi:hypothetical protein
MKNKSYNFNFLLHVILTISVFAVGCSNESTSTASSAPAAAAPDAPAAPAPDAPAAAAPDAPAAPAPDAPAAPAPDAPASLTPVFVKITKDNCSQVTDITTGMGNLYASLYSVNPKSVQLQSTQIINQACYSVIAHEKGVCTTILSCGIRKPNSDLIGHNCIFLGDSIVPMMSAC